MLNTKLNTLTMLECFFGYNWHLVTLLHDNAGTIN